jgi:formylglycine-generating enzyme required for sulfatase activity
MGGKMKCFNIILKSYIIFSSFIIYCAEPKSESLSTKALSVGHVFKDCSDCPEMIVIPDGYFMIGSARGKERELPVTGVTISNPLAVSRYEVTFDEWDACHAAGGCNKKPYDRGWGRGKRPVINILHTDVAQYMLWLSKETGHKYRLPSEAEWEYAARAGSKTEFFWGNKMHLGAANCRECGTKWSGIKTAPVGQFKSNSWGLFDVHGNVLELVTDCWSKSHKELPTNGLPLITKNCKSKVIKGGAWYYLPRVSRSSSRARNDVRVASYFIGFRAFREVD